LDPSTIGSPRQAAGHINRSSIIKRGFTLLGFDILDPVGQLVPVTEAVGLKVFYLGRDEDDEIQNHRLDALPIQVDAFDIQSYLPILDDDFSPHVDIHLGAEDFRDLLSFKVDKDLPFKPLVIENLQAQLLHDLFLFGLDAVGEIGVELALCDLDLLEDISIFLELRSDHVVNHP